MVIFLYEVYTPSNTVILFHVVSFICTQPLQSAKYITTTHPRCANLNILQLSNNFSKNDYSVKLLLFDKKKNTPLRNL